MALTALTALTAPTVTGAMDPTDMERMAHLALTRHLRRSIPRRLPRPIPRRRPRPRKQYPFHLLARSQSFLQLAAKGCSGRLCASLAIAGRMPRDSALIRSRIIRRFGRNKRLANAPFTQPRRPLGRGGPERPVRLATGGDGGVSLLSRDRKLAHDN